MFAQLGRILQTVSPRCRQVAEINTYQNWPREKIRRVGRKPGYWKGQVIRRGRIPYDRRYPLTGKYANDTTQGLVYGGNKYMPGIIGEERAQQNPAVIKYYDYVKDREIHEVVPEMIPEFVVPDLEGFKLTPYVSYRVTHEAATRDKHTAAELFKETYEVDILKSKKHDAS